MSTAPSPDRRDVILNAALKAFARYGYRRTSMEDVADLAGVSRPLLYTYFKNKGDLFESMAIHLVERAMADAEAAWPVSAAFETGFIAAALAKNLPLMRLVHASPHAEELLAQSAASGVDYRAELDARFAALVAKRLGKRRDAAALARVAVQALAGLKRATMDEAQFTADVRLFAKIFARGL